MQNRAKQLRPALHLRLGLHPQRRQRRLKNLSLKLHLPPVLLVPKS